MPCRDFKIQWKHEDIADVVSRRSGGSLVHDLRLWEAESAIEMKMVLEEWYKLPLIEREHIVAVRISSLWIDSLLSEEAISKSKRAK